MGYYINPTDRTKEAWLNVYGMPVQPPMADTKAPEGAHFAVLVDNGAFTAAAIANDADELRYFTESPKRGDQRPMTWFLVPDADLVAVCPQVEKALR